MIKINSFDLFLKLVTEAAASDTLCKLFYYEKSSFVGVIAPGAQANTLRFKILLISQLGGIAYSEKYSLESDAAEIERIRKLIEDFPGSIKADISIPKEIVQIS